VNLTEETWQPKQSAYNSDRIEDIGATMVQQLADDQHAEERDEQTDQVRPGRFGAESVSVIAGKALR
jgi:hypothetical protein